MGFIHAHNLNKYNAEYNLKIFIETGIGKGVGLIYALNFNYKTIYSVELLDHFYNNAVEKFKNEKRIKLFNGKSVDKLDEMLNSIDPADNILFWLDAHLPSFYVKKKYAPDIEFPLEQELNIIKNKRNTDNDVFIIDDLRIYEPGNYVCGNYSGRISDNINFIHELFDNTHEITKDYRDQGYIILLPKKNNADFK